MAHKKQKDELALDFSGLKSVFSKGKKKRKKSAQSSRSSSNDEISIDVQSIARFIKKYRVVFILLIPLLLGAFIRVQPADQHYTQNWAKDYIRNINMQVLTQQKAAQYPNLPAENLNALVQEDYKSLLDQGVVFMPAGSGQVQTIPYEQAVSTVSNEYKKVFQDPQGQNYLHDIDTWLWYGLVRNYVNSDYKSFGDEIDESGKPIYSLRNGRHGTKALWNFHTWSISLLYRVGNIFSDDWTILKATYYISVVVMLLATIPVFFIARKIAGDLGGLIAAIVFAIQPALLSRTLGGVADTDPWTVFFPVLLTWIFLEAWEAQNRRLKMALIGVFGIVIGYFYLAWNGWWYIFNFILGMMGLYFLYQLYLFRKTLRKNFRLFLKKIEIQNSLIILFGIPLSTYLFGPLLAYLYQGVNQYYFYLQDFVYRTFFSLVFVSIKEVAVRTHWPNVLTTVAELNPGSIQGTIGSMGGWLLFLISIAGILATILKKNAQGKRDVKLAIFLTLWYVGTLYATTQGIRFSALLVPAFAIALGAAVGIITGFVSNWAHRELSIRPILTKGVIMVLVILMLSGTVKSAYNTATGAMPIVNDAWYNSLTEIKEDSDDAIISSWWDFGHFFAVIAERHVTFDGGDQGRRIHWIGKSLLTRDENEAVGILRMLNCDQEKMIDKSLNYSQNNTYEAVQTLYELAVIPDRNNAKEYLTREVGYSEAQADDLLESTHCNDLLKQYYITSADMVGKSGVWGHFGSWDFNRSMMFSGVRNQPFEKGMQILIDDFAIPQADAARIYTEIQTQSGDQWISPWPGYINQQPVGCQRQGDIVSCENGANLNLTTYDSFFVIGQGEIAYPRYFSYIDENGEFKIKEYTENLVPTNSDRGIGVSFIPIGNGNYQSVLSDELLVGSMFTRLYFYNGHGLEHFEHLTTESTLGSGKIQVWRVNFESQDPIIVDAFTPRQDYVINLIAWIDNLGVFDSTIVDWQNKSITAQSSFEDFETEPRRYDASLEKIGELFDAVVDLEIGEQTTVEVAPDEQYPNSPSQPIAEEFRNQTMYFKIKLEDIINVAP